MNGDSYSRDGGRQSSSRNYSSRDDGRDRRRRRSRSPRHSSRRDYEVDTYSSSRDYREREREDTYARRERREDRAWGGGGGGGGGDTYSRRDGGGRDRRDDDRGHSRRDRGPRGGFDEDRDRDGGRGRRDRGGDRDGGFGGGRDRKKSASPPARKREPTPDLTDVISIQKRQRRMTQWDIKPSGYDNITAEQAKLSGMFPLPGAPRAAPMDPSKLAAFISPSAGNATAAALKPSNAKQAKRLLVYNLPTNATPDIITEFFNLQLNGLNVVSAHDPCLSALISSDRSYALLEFKAPEDATMALTLDGVTMEEDTGAPDRPGLSIRRPKEYIVPDVAEEDADAMTDGPSSDVKDSPYKLSIRNIPSFIEDQQIRELLEAFGELKTFIVVKEHGSDQNRGVAFCEYRDSSIVDQVIEGLNTIALGDSNLVVKRASIGATQAGAGLDGGVGAISMLAGSSATSGQDSGRVLCLMNMVTNDELLDNDSYEEIKEDVQDECSKYGQILDLKIPRPAGARVNPGVGKIFIKYATPEAAQKALKALAGRQFSSRTVVVTHFSEELFDVDAW